MNFKTKNRSQPIIVHQEPYTNLSPAGWVLDPLDKSRFLLYIGRFLGNTSVGADIAVYSGDCRDPFHVTFDRLVLARGEPGSGDENGVRFGSVVASGGQCYHYYVGMHSARAQSIMLAVSEDGRRFTKRGTVVESDGIHEYYMTDPTVIILDGTWYMYVTGKSKAKLPNLGIIVYTSADGLAWRRAGVTAIPMGAPGSYDAKYIEGCEVHQEGRELVSLYTCCSNDDIWSIAMARGADPLKPFAKVDRNPVFECSPARWDSGGVAVPLLVRFPSGRRVMYYQGSRERQPANNWDIGAVEIE